LPFFVFLIAPVAFSTVHHRRVRLGTLVVLGAYFTSKSPDFFEQAAGYPLTGVGAPVHNTPLTYAVDLGLVGLTLWILGLALGVGGALATRGPPDLLPWRVGLLAVTTTFLVVVSAVPPTAWPNRSLWLLAGVVYSGRYLTAGPSASWAHAQPAASQG
jgi:hypothetical protein